MSRPHQDLFVKTKTKTKTKTGPPETKTKTGRPETKTKTKTGPPMQLQDKDQSGASCYIVSHSKTLQ